ncbi:GNAT family N-acetyltransferase [Cupriavidus sp. UYPR2.512]|uniref:GNAT family N-acetyltransferase n=1 Tax=Cupriavidus sp. UYPR2.512 TaxID=1080187 RepID=UPI000373ACBF|nr:GNAT family N-acetyltransferase [Cupriavidus sp. UYPR2.512]UIF88536.1 GNAT family N-acetyltransferase [Cupriavidus necator]
MSEFRFPALIESDDLLMRPPEVGDAHMLFNEMLGDPTTTRDLSFKRHTQLDETLAFIEESAAGWRSGTLIRWVLELRASGRLTGLIELQPHPPRVEVGFIITRRDGARRLRAPLYALRKLLQWTLAQPPILRIYAHCAVDGDAHSAMERLGFTFEGRLTNFECRPNLGLPAADSYLYAMTRSLDTPKYTPATLWLLEHMALDY